MKNEIQLLHGDCLERLKELPNNSVDSVITDPPYGLSFMGKKWDYDVPSEEVWRECLRVLKPGGHLLAFAGTRTQHRMAVRIEDAGFEIRDMIAWVYGSGFPKSLNIGKAVDKLQGNEREVVGIAKGAGAGMSDNLVAINKGLRPEYEATKGTSPHEGWGTALKPALEPVTVARKPLVGTVAANVLTHGTGGINVDGCRVRTSDVIPKMTGKAILGGSSDGWDRPWKNDPDGLARRQVAADAAIEKANTLGRWPANLIHDGSDEVVRLFPQAKGQQGAVGPQYGHKTSVNAYGNFGPRQTFEPRADSGSAARFFYCAKASKADRDEGCEGLAEVASACNLRQAGGLPKAAKEFCVRNHHPTVKPTDLMRYLCRLVTPPHGIVLDPFMGSGSTGKAAALEGFQFIGIEREAEYMEIAKARIESAKTLV